MGGLEPVAQKLFIVARGVAAHGVLVGGPVARAVGREHLVHQDQLALGVQAELEFGVGDDDALLERDGGRGLVQRDRDVPDLGGQLGADHLDGFLKRDVFVVLTHLGFGRWGVDGLGQTAGVVQAFGKLHATHRAAVLVFLPTAAGQVATHHSLYRNRFQALHQHGAAGDLWCLFGADHALRRVTGEVDGTNVQPFGAELLEPKQAQAGEQSALAGDGLTHDDVERTDAVGSHHEDAVVTDGVVVADFAASQQRQGGQGRGVQCRSHEPNYLSSPPAPTPLWRNAGPSRSRCVP